MKISDDISVVIPTYNGSKFIEDTIKSIYSQTVLPREIIVVDDVSTDNTKEIVKGLQDISPVPLYFIQLDKNSGGPAKPINVGVEKAKGEYIAICEQDDLMLPNKIEMIDKFIKLEPKVQFIISRYNVLIFDKLKRNDVIDESFSEFKNIKKKRILNNFYIFDKEDAYFYAIKKCFAVSLSNMSFSKLLWKEITGLNEELKRIVDWDFLIRTSYRYKIGWIDSPLWIFRRHFNSTAQNTNFTMWTYEGLKIWHREIKKKNLNKKVKSEICYHLFSIYKKLNKNLKAKFYFFKALVYNPKDSFAKYHFVSYLETNSPTLYKFLKIIF